MPCLSAALYCKTASLRDIRMAPSSFIDQRKIPLLLFRREAVISFIFVLLQQKSDGNKKTPGCKILGNGIRRRPTLPGRVQPSTIGAEGLNFCVRYGNRWDPFAIATGNCIVVWGLRSVMLHSFILAQGTCFSSRSLPLLWGSFRSVPCLPAAHGLSATSLCQV